MMICKVKGVSDMRSKRTSPEEQLISRTQTENFLRLRYGKMWHLNEDYPYSYKRHGEK